MSLYTKLNDYRIRVAGLALLSLTLSGCPQYEKGMIPPSKIDIHTEDNDKNGKLETVLKYKNQKYLVKEGNDGRPKLVPFVVEPERIRELEETVEEKTPDPKPYTKPDATTAKPILKPGYAEKPTDDFPFKK